MEIMKNNHLEKAQEDLNSIDIKYIEEADELLMRHGKKRFLP